MRIPGLKPSLGPREAREQERQRAKAEAVEAQAFFTAVMTDTYLDTDDEGEGATEDMEVETDE